MNDETKKVDIKKDLYLCSPLLNKDCSKEICYINNGCCHLTVTKKYSQQYLLDYITNLQEELKYQKEAELEYNEKHAKLMNMYKDLQEENERLKELCDKYEEERKTTFNIWKETIEMEEK